MTLSSSRGIVRAMRSAVCAGASAVAGRAWTAPATGTYVELHALADFPQQEASAAHVAASDEVHGEPQALAEDRAEHADVTSGEAMLPSSTTSRASPISPCSATRAAFERTVR